MLCDVLSVTPTKGFVKGEKGYDKLLIFMDSLTRWVEAIPFNGDPTSEDVLDAFLTVVFLVVVFGFVVIFKSYS